MSKMLVLIMMDFNMMGGLKSRPKIQFTLTSGTNENFS
jgi:hypothetical protein